VSSLLGPTLYIMFGYLDVGDEAEGETLADATELLLKSVRMLDNEGAKILADNAIRLQLAVYNEAEGEEAHPMFVRPRGCNGIVAWRKERNGLYARYENGDEESVAVGDLEPPLAESLDLERRCMDEGCCKGWFAPSFLTPKNRKDTFERRCNFLDTIRSFFLVEVPFGCIRGYFDFVVARGLPSLFLVKNIVWGVTDFLNLLSCGNEKATCFSLTPIELIQRMVKGSPLDSIMVGPSGMWAHTADMAKELATNTLAAEKQQLTLHKAWLVLNREKIQTAGRESRKNVDDLVQSFTASIRTYQERIAVVEQKMTQIRITG